MITQTEKNIRNFDKITNDYFPVVIYYLLKTIALGLQKYTLLIISTII
jgi:hypothetical protein